MYKLETIKNLLNSFNLITKEYEAKLENNETVTACISCGNRKIGRVMNFSLAPIITCGHRCAVCMHECYDIKACIQYKAVMNARIRNTVLARKAREDMMNFIIAKCARRKKNKYFRWHVSGDIIDIDYFDWMVKIARMFPEFRFWTYTKQYEIVNEYVKNHGGDRFTALPDNLVVMFSRWDGIEMINPYNFPEFYAVHEDLIDKVLSESEDVYCCGNCEKCIEKQTGCVFGKSCFIKIH